MAAKTIEMFPDKGKKKNVGKQANSNPEEIVGDFLGLLRAVVDGDKEAIEELRSLLDVWDKIGFLMPDFLSDEEDYDEEDYDDEDEDCLDPTILHSPMTLPRKEVKELHLRIKLNRTDLKIWRELKVPSNITLEALAKVLLDAMGWKHEHLYQFVIGNEFYGHVTKDDFPSLFGGINEHDITQYTLSDVLQEKGKRIKFEYDFGDDWQHDLWIKGEREYTKGEKPSVTCVKGQGACPPEDCGGVWGYADLLELRNKKRLTRDEKERLEWYDMLTGFDPDEFNKEFVDELMENWTDKLLD